jgi:hypothetical protein
MCASTVKLRVEALEDRCLLSVYDVTGTADGLGTVSPGGPGKFDASTLRAAVIAADQSGNKTANTIILPAGTYALTLAGAEVFDSTSGQLTISSYTKLTIEGAGAGHTVIDASQLGDRLFYIDEGANLNLQGLTLQNGKVAGHSSEDGGCIYNFEGNLQINRCVLTGNQAGDLTESPDEASGGAIYNYGNARLVATTVSNNQALGLDTSGGGIFNLGTLVAINCTIAGNRATGVHAGSAWGGGIDTENGNATTLIDCAVTGNIAAGGNSSGNALGNQGGGADGGGIFIEAVPVTIIGCTISGNEAIGGNADESSTTPGFAGAASGGGVANDFGGTLTIRNSTLSRNKAIGGTLTGPSSSDEPPGFGDGMGGGIYTISDGPGDVDFTRTVISNSTITLNQASGGNPNHPSGVISVGLTVGSLGIGGGIDAEDLRSGSVIVTRTIIAGNTASNADSDVAGAFVGKLNELSPRGSPG